MSHHDSIQVLIHDYADGDLRPDDRAAVEAHVAECAECSAELHFLLALRERAGELPRVIAPRRDLWAGIAARLEERGAAAGPQVIPLDRTARRRTSQPAWRGRAMLAVAATVLVALTSVITARLMQQDAGVAPVALGPAVVGQPAATEERAVTSLAAFAPMEAEYLGTLELLELQLEAGRESLSPQTLVVVEENLRIIDRAILEIQTALRADSTSVELPLLLGGAYRSKVELLQSVVQLYARS
jgi:anti-sigma-K factor RskA